MDLQTAFYIIGIIAMVLFIAVMVGALLFMFYVRRLIGKTQKAVVGKIVEYTRPVDVITGIGSAVLDNVLLKLKSNLGMR
ncbi:MAG TPA: hypothetical protein VHE53_03410 [Patescibacteria group bacterium]|nr:hypothetical protein [Patescibacteria group bacterium]